MTEQLTLDGSEPRPERRLTQRQRDLWLWMALTPSREITTAQAGRFYDNPSGALRRLESFGAVERVRRGYWRAT